MLHAIISACIYPRFHRPVYTSHTNKKVKVSKDLLKRIHVNTMDTYKDNIHTKARLINLVFLWENKIFTNDP